MHQRTRTVSLYTYRIPIESVIARIVCAVVHTDDDDPEADTDVEPATAHCPM